MRQYLARLVLAAGRLSGANAVRHSACAAVHAHKASSRILKHTDLTERTISSNAIRPMYQLSRRYATEAATATADPSADAVAPDIVSVAFRVLQAE